MFRKGCGPVRVLERAENIILLDPNMFACRDWKELSKQLIDSRAWVDFSQGCDIRIMTEEKVQYIRQMKIKNIHFAWDRYEDKNFIIPKFEMFKNLTGWDHRKDCICPLRI